MTAEIEAQLSRKLAQGEVEKFRLELGPFVVAADDTRMPANLGRGCHYCPRHLGCISCFLRRCLE